MVDSTKAKHKGWKGGGLRDFGPARSPCNYDLYSHSAPMDTPKTFHKRFEDPIVYIFHPWEFVRMSRRLRPDCWVGTGKNALENLHS